MALAVALTGACGGGGTPEEKWKEKAIEKTEIKIDEKAGKTEIKIEKEEKEEEKEQEKTAEGEPEEEEEKEKEEAPEKEKEEETL